MLGTTLCFFSFPALSVRRCVRVGAEAVSELESPVRQVVGRLSWCRGALQRRQSRFFPFALAMVNRVDPAGSTTLGCRPARFVANQFSINIEGRITPADAIQQSN